MRSRKLTMASAYTHDRIKRDVSSSAKYTERHTLHPESRLTHVEITPDMGVVKNNIHSHHYLGRISGMMPMQHITKRFRDVSNLVPN